MPKTAKTLLCILLAVLLAAGSVLLGERLWHACLLWSYPQKYDAQVQHWAAEYGQDPLLIDAFIRTESGFDPKTQSGVDARGLMQITEETFDWIKGQIAPDEDLAFDDLYDPEVNIRFGCYYVMRCMDRYHGDVSTAAAAYHSGWGTVDTLLQNTAYSPDGRVLTVFPYNQMQNYVAKIGRAYERYRLIYSPE